MKMSYILIPLVLTLLITMPQGEAASNSQVNSGDDDADERGNGTFSTTRVTADIYSNPNTGINNYRCAGFRFENIPIDQGEYVENAYIELYLVNLDDMNAIFYAHDADNSVDFATNANIIDNVQRPKTDNYFAWIENDIGINGWENSDNLANIIQEIVNRPGWEKGNTITILAIALDYQTITANTRTYDFNTALAAKLHIHYQPTIGDTYYPTRAVPRHTINIRQLLNPNGQKDATSITAKINFSSDNFFFTENTPENDVGIEDCTNSNGCVHAEWFVSTPGIEDNYTFYVEWEYIHEDYHYEVSDNYTIEVKYFVDPTPHPIQVYPLSSSGTDALSIVALGFAAVAMTLVLKRKNDER